MKINLIRYANSMDPNALYLKDSEQFLEDINNELFEDDLELVEGVTDPVYSIIFIDSKRHNPPLRVKSGAKVQKRSEK